MPFSTVLLKMLFNETKLGDMSSMEYLRVLDTEESIEKHKKYTLRIQINLSK